MGTIDRDHFDARRGLSGRVEKIVSKVATFAAPLAIGLSPGATIIETLASGGFATVAAASSLKEIAAAGVDLIPKGRIKDRRLRYQAQPFVYRGEGLEIPEYAWEDHSTLSDGNNFYWLELPEVVIKSPGTDITSQKALVATRNQIWTDTTITTLRNFLDKANAGNDYYWKAVAIPSLDNMPAEVRDRLPPTTVVKMADLFADKGIPAHKLGEKKVRVISRADLIEFFASKPVEITVRKEKITQQEALVPVTEQEWRPSELAQALGNEDILTLLTEAKLIQEDLSDPDREAKVLDLTSQIGRRIDRILLQSLESNGPPSMIHYPKFRTEKQRPIRSMSIRNGENGKYLQVFIDRRALAPIPVNRQLMGILPDQTWEELEDTLKYQGQIAYFIAEKLQQEGIDGLFEAHEIVKEVPRLVPRVEIQDVKETIYEKMQIKPVDEVLQEIHEHEMRMRRQRQGVPGPAYFDWKIFLHEAKSIKPKLRNIAFALGLIALVPTIGNLVTPLPAEDAYSDQIDASQRRPPALIDFSRYLQGFGARARPRPIEIHNATPTPMLVLDPDGKPMFVDANGTPIAVIDPNASPVSRGEAPPLTATFTPTPTSTPVPIPILDGTHPPMTVSPDGTPVYITDPSLSPVASGESRFQPSLTPSPTATLTFTPTPTPAPPPTATPGPGIGETLAETAKDLANRTANPERELPSNEIVWRVQEVGGMSSSGYYSVSTSHTYNNGTWELNRTRARKLDLPKAVEGPQLKLTQYESVNPATGYTFKIPIRHGTQVGSLSVKSRTTGRELEVEAHQLEDGTVEGVILPFVDLATIEIQASLIPYSEIGVRATKPIAPIDLSKLGERARQTLNQGFDANDQFSNAIIQAIRSSHKYSLKPKGHEKLKPVQSAEERANVIAEWEECWCFTCNELNTLLSTHHPEGVPVNLVMGFIHTMGGPASEDPRLRAENTSLREDIRHAWGVDSFSRILDATPGERDDEDLTDQYIRQLQRLPSPTPAPTIPPTPIPAVATAQAAARDARESGQSAVATAQALLDSLMATNTPTPRPPTNTPVPPTATPIPPTPTETPIPTDTPIPPTATDTPMPTETPTPTNTLPPTNTPRPIDTAAPTRTVNASPSPIAAARTATSETLPATVPTTPTPTASPTPETQGEARPSSIPDWLGPAAAAVVAGAAGAGIGYWLRRRRQSGEPIPQQETPQPAFIPPDSYKEMRNKDWVVTIGGKNEVVTKADVMLGGVFLTWLSFGGAFIDLELGSTSDSELQSYYERTRRDPTLDNLRGNISKKRLESYLRNPKLFEDSAGLTEEQGAEMRRLADILIKLSPLPLKP